MGEGELWAKSSIAEEFAPAVGGLVELRGAADGVVAVPTVAFRGAAMEIRELLAHVLPAVCFEWAES